MHPGEDELAVAEFAWKDRGPAGYLLADPGGPTPISAGDLEELIRINLAAQPPD